MKRLKQAVVRVWDVLYAIGIKKWTLKQDYKSFQFVCQIKTTWVWVAQRKKHSLLAGALLDYIKKKK
jgi:hypothetical protein